MPRPRPVTLEPFLPLLEGVARLLHPHAEVVVHDVARDRILAIWNPLSGRRVGEPSLLGQLPAGESGFGVLGPYEKRSREGHRLTSVSAEIDDGAALVCVNLDRAPLDQAIEVLSAFAAPVTARPPVLFNRDWREQITLLVEERTRRDHVDRARLDRRQRLDLVRALDAEGLFAVRNAAQHVARTLGVSRATVYTLLKEARS